MINTKIYLIEATMPMLMNTKSKFNQNNISHLGHSCFMNIPMESIHQILMIHLKSN